MLLLSLLRPCSLHTIIVSPLLWGFGAAGAVKRSIASPELMCRLGTKMINLAKEHATRALANLAMNDLAIDEMEQKGGVEPVMELVGHKDPKLVTEAVRGLANGSACRPGHCA